MLGDAFLAIAQGVVGFFAGLLPSGTLIPGLVLPTGWLYGYDFLNTFLPVSEVLYAASILLALRLAVFAFRLVIFVWSQVPVVGGHGA